MEVVAWPLLGIGNGGVYAALALALVITFRSSGVVNFATGAIGLYVAYTYAFLRQGDLLVPIPGLPPTLGLGGPLPFAAAMVISLVIAAGFGALLYAVVFRPLRNAPDTAKAVASIGVMIVIQAVLAQRVGTTPVSTRPIFPTRVLTIADVRVRGELLWFAATIIAVATALWAGYRFTRFGLATRAAAETEKGALVTGLSPERIALANWGVGAAVAGLAGILIAPIVPLIPVSYTLFIVPALAAAVLAGFTSFGVAVAGGLGIGMVQAVLDQLAARWSWLPRSGRAEMVPLVLLIVYLVWRGRALPTRGAIVRRTLGRAPRARRLALPALVGTVAGLAALALTSGSARAAVIDSLIFGVISLSLVVVTGYAGQISLAQLTLAGVGAFTLSRLTDGWGVPFPAAPLLAALAATVIGVVIGLPALRVRAISVGVVTLATATALEALWFRNPDLGGGFAGAAVESPSLLGVDLAVGAGRDFPRIEFGILCLVVLVLVALSIAWLRASRFGSAMLAVRANERSAAAAGINVGVTKLGAFALASFIAGLGGALLAYRQTVVTADAYSAIVGLALFATVYLAGITSIAGGVVAGALATGGVVFYILDRSVALGRWYATVVGVGLVVTVILNPEGVVRPLHDLAARWRARRDRRAAARPSDAAGISDVEVAGRLRRVDETVEATPLLSLERVTVRYGGVVAVDEVDLDVEDGSLVGLIGPNGAGKTTLIDAVSGFVACSGRIAFDGRPIDSLPPHRRIRAGLGRTFQSIELYDDLTVAENVLVGAIGSSDDADEVFELLHLSEVRDVPARELSQGRRQLVSVARALATRPRLLMLDEPAAGLDSAESAWLGERVRDIRARGVTVVMVEHDMDLVLGICDRIVVLDLGCVIADGTPASIRDDPVVREAYLGTGGEVAG